MTHKSFVQGPDRPFASNERLEFLGDAVLGAIVADYLCEVFPEKTEGELTEIRAEVVKRDHLNRIALDMGLQHWIVHETEHDLPSTSLAGNALEAIIGALYLDRGYDATRKGIIRALVPRYMQPGELAARKKNAKSRLLEWAQRERRNVNFHSTRKVLPDGKEVFHVAVHIDAEPMGHGHASNKKSAEFEAASEAIQKLGLKE